MLIPRSLWTSMHKGTRSPNEPHKITSAAYLSRTELNSCGNIKALRHPEGFFT
jgi:hypothetical protein